MEILNIKRLKIFTLSAIVILVTIIGGFRLADDINNAQKIHQEKEELILKQIQYLYDKELRMINNGLISRGKYLVNSDIVKDSFKTKNRNKLLKLASSRYKIMKKSFPTLCIMHFHFSDNTSFLRVHKPDVYGDNLKQIRPMITKTIQTKKIQTGFEEGLFESDKVIYRIALPIWDENNFLGILEFGLDLGYFLQEVKHTIESIYDTNSYANFLLYSNSTKFQTSSNEQIKFGPFLIPKDKSLISRLLSIADFKKGHEHLHLDDKVYHTSWGDIYLKNYEGNSLGVLLYIIDETSFQNKYDRMVQRAIAIPLMIIVVFLLFFNWLFNYFLQKVASAYIRTTKIIDTQNSIIILSDGTKMNECNKILLDMFGYSTFKDFIKDHNCICDFFLQEEGKNYLKKIDENGIKWDKKILDNPKKIHEVLMKDKNGNMHIFEVKGKKFTQNEEIFVFNDITEMVRQKEETIKQNKIVFEQSKMAAMGEMIGNIAHQWRQPLSVISTSSTGMKLQEEMGMLTHEHIIKTCTTINSSAQFLSKTIDDFRNFFKKDKHKEKYQIKDVVAQSMSLVNASLKDNNISLITDIEHDFTLKGFPNEIVQALINILNNAKDVLTDKDYDRYIFITVTKNDNDCVIKIKDNGGGIPDDITNRLFEPYFTTKQQSQGGTGIGLYMTREIIVKHSNGNIEVYNREYEYNNKVYKGAEFIVKLPLS